MNASVVINTIGVATVVPSWFAPITPSAVATTTVLLVAFTVTAPTALIVASSEMWDCELLTTTGAAIPISSVALLDTASATAVASTPVLDVAENAPVALIVALPATATSAETVASKAAVVGSTVGFVTLETRVASAVNVISLPVSDPVTRTLASRMASGVKSGVAMLPSTDVALIVMSFATMLPLTVTLGKSPTAWGTTGMATEVASRMTSPLAAIVLVTLMVSAFTVTLRAFTGPTTFTTSVPASPFTIKSMPGAENELTVSTSCNDTGVETNGTPGTTPVL